jgi:hypothetical protein
MAGSSVFGDRDGAGWTCLGSRRGGSFKPGGNLLDEALAGAEALVVGLEDLRTHRVATAVTDALLPVD